MSQVILWSAWVVPRYVVLCILQFCTVDATQSGVMHGCFVASFCSADRYVCGKIHAGHTINIPLVTEM